MFTFVIWCIGLCFIYVIGYMVIAAIVVGFQAIKGNNDYGHGSWEIPQGWAKPPWRQDQTGLKRLPGDVFAPYYRQHPPEPSAPRPQMSEQRAYEVRAKLRKERGKSALADCGEIGKHVERQMLRAMYENPSDTMVELL